MKRAQYFRQLFMFECPSEFPCPPTALGQIELLQSLVFMLVESVTKKMHAGPITGRIKNFLENELLKNPKPPPTTLLGPQNQ